MQLLNVSDGSLFFPLLLTHHLSLPLSPHCPSEQKEKKDLNPRTLNPRKIKTRKDEWERRKMGEEFVVPKNDLT